MFEAIFIVWMSMASIASSEAASATQVSKER